MQKEILDLVNNFAEWRGNSFTLAMSVALLVKERAAAVADNDGQPEVAEKIRGL